MPRASTANAIRQFGALVGRTLTKALSATKEDRRSLILSENHRCERWVYRTEELPSELANAIAVAEPDSKAFAFDHEVNGAAKTAVQSH
ncbi:hypothetical protein [Hyphomicrobium sp. NDB2Meth4]|uniref:hypothetical protein n=1 Tax=Hyphomicrobium sp. NDB2Meth4 TaxID=1892846 RepID=UPI000AA1C470|nr:hypothetical protein [Hyphomicrobium sp. NDB2Meth4]